MMALDLIINLNLILTPEPGSPGGVSCPWQRKAPGLPGGTSPAVDSYQMISSGLIMRYYFHFLIIKTAMLRELRRQVTRESPGSKNKMVSVTCLRANVSLAVFCHALPWRSTPRLIPPGLIENN